MTAIKVEPSSGSTAEAVFQECEFSERITHDREACVIRGVKVLGHVSVNGRVYKPEALERAAPLYEGVRVNVNHSTADMRDYRDRLGLLKSVRSTPDGLFADLHYNPKHPIAEQLAWDAEHAPGNVGMSHNVFARSSKRDGKTIVEEILRVTSVDLVADPATTKSLFESAGNHDAEDESMADAIDYSTVTLEKLAESRPDLVEAIGKKAVADKVDATELDKAKAENARLAAEVKTLTESRQTLAKELDELKTAQALIERKAKRQQMLAEAKLPEAALTEAFKSFVESAATDEEAATLIEDRKALAGMIGQKPQSKESLAGGSAEPVVESKQLVAGWRS